MISNAVFCLPDPRSPVNKFPVPTKRGLKPSIALKPVVNVFLILSRLMIDGLSRKKRGTLVVVYEEEEGEEGEGDEDPLSLLPLLSSIVSICIISSSSIVVDNDDEDDDERGRFPSIGLPRQSTTRPQNSRPRLFVSTGNDALVVAEVDDVRVDESSKEEFLPVSSVKEEEKEEKGEEEEDDVE